MSHINQTVVGRPAHLDHEVLVEAQKETLAGPRREYGVAARLLFRLLHTVYGKKRRLPKFEVLELVARVPYRS